MSSPTSTMPSEPTHLTSDLASAPIRVPHPHKVDLVKTNTADGTNATFEADGSTESGVFRFTGKHVLRGDPMFDGKLNKVIVISRLQGDETAPTEGVQELLDVETWIKPERNNGFYQSTGKGTFNVGDMDSIDGKYILRSLACSSFDIGLDLFEGKTHPSPSIDVRPMFTGSIDVRPVDDIHHIEQTLPDGTTRSLIAILGVQANKWSMWGLGGIETAEIYDPEGDEMIIEDEARLKFYEELEKHYPGQSANISIRTRAAEVAAGRASQASS